MVTFSVRPYQQEAKTAILREWDEGRRRTLLVLPTGCGKTIVFCQLIEELVRAGKRVLIMAHRGELLDQAADKLSKSTGLGCAVEKADSTCLGEFYRVVVGSVQTLMREKRLAQFPPNYFDAIIVDEAHHCLSDSYQRVLAHFAEADVLGVTATPDRGDMKNLGQFFDSLAYEYSLPRAIRDGYLCPIKAMTIPLKIDLRGVAQQSGDFAAAGLGSALDPYLEQIADHMFAHCAGRKTVVFLPLIATSQRFCDLLKQRGFRAAEVNGESQNRAAILKAFDTWEEGVLCNSMLLCLDEETEILTDRGFLRHNEIAMTDKVANWNMDGSVFFEEPLEIVHRPLADSEYMVAIESRTINLRVTNTHRMVVGRGAGNKEWKKIAASELRSGHTLPAFGVAEPQDLQIEQPAWPEIDKRNIIRTAHYLRKTKQCATTDESYIEARRRKEAIRDLRYTQPSELTLDECRLIGFWIADGSKNLPRSGGIEYTLCQSPKYPNIVSWIESLLRSVGVDYIRRDRDRDPLAVVWSLPRGTGSGSQARKGLFAIEPYLEKNGSPLFWALNEIQFDALVEGYWYGDGHHGQAENGMPDSILMSDTKKGWLDLLCAIGSVRGWRCSMSFIPMANEKHKDQWSLRMIKGRHLVLSHKTPIKAESFRPENVWCVRTTSKNIITKRDGHVTVMGNTEGWDCPSVDCVVPLRPTKIRSLFCQMIGRGTRLFPGKTELLLLDFLWNTERLDLCRPACLIAGSEDVAKQMTENINEAGAAVDLIEAEEKAESDCVAQREEALAKKLAEMRNRKAKLVDPLQYEMSIAAEDLSGYVPSFGWEMAPVSEPQKEALEKAGILPDAVECAGKASILLDRLNKRRAEGYTTPRQIRFLEGKKFKNVGEWEFNYASKMITRIQANGWRVPQGMNPETHKPEATSQMEIAS